MLPEFNTVFIPIPNEGQPWPDQFISVWQRDWSRTHGPAKDNFSKYLAYKVRGTTFSGESMTTLMNTIRKVLYSYYDIHISLNIRRPWRDGRFFVLAAGDDGCTFGNR